MSVASLPCSLNALTAAWPHLNASTLSLVPWNARSGAARALSFGKSGPGHEPETGKPGSLLLALAEGEVDRVDAGLVTEAARRGDPLAEKVIQHAAQAFGTGVFNILMLFQPEMIVLSGGVMRSLDLFMPAIERAIQAADSYIPARAVRILPAKLGYYAGIYGAAYAILNKLAINI